MMGYGRRNEMLAEEADRLRQRDALEYAAEERRDRAELDEIQACAVADAEAAAWFAANPVKPALTGWRTAVRAPMIFNGAGKRVA